jgi:hypothetical protein
MAWLSDFDTSAKTRFAPSPGPYQLVNGTIIATSFADLVDGMLRAPISVTERGTVSDATAVWTGTDTSGTAIGDLFCDNWTEASPEFNTMVGRADSTGSAWTAALFESCLTFSAHLYCFQQR